MDFVKGRLVRSKAGRDKGRTFAVVGEENGILLLVNGGLRGLERPKRKKICHVAPTQTVLSPEVLCSDETLSKAILAFDTKFPN